MLTRDDLIDAIVGHILRSQEYGSFRKEIGKQGSVKEGPRARIDAAPPFPSGRRTPSEGSKASRLDSEGPKGRPFLTERDIRRLLAPGAHEISVPAGAIISPLAADWLILSGIRVKIKQ